MSLFRRKKSPDAAPGATIVGVPPAAQATGDFDVVVRALITQMSGEPVTELGDDTIGAGKASHYLGNLRAGWATRAPGERELWLRNAIHGFYKSELKEMGQLDTSMLRPGIRSLWTANLPMLMAMESSPGTMPDPTAVIAHRPMADGIVRVLIWDTPTTMGLVSEHQIAEWGADFDSLWNIAVANLAGDPKTGGWAKLNDQVWISLDEDDYAAERVFVDGHLDGTDLGEYPVMFHPHRNILILADLMDPEGLATAAKIAEASMDKPNQVSFTPIVGRGLSWHPLSLDPGHPAAAAIRRMRVTESTHVYGHQQQLLTNIYGDELFVASFKAYATEGEGILTMASWTQDVASLLPRTEHIALVSDSGGPTPEILTVTWETAQAIVGHRMEPTTHYPERVRVMSFPDGDELAALRNNAS